MPRALRIRIVIGLSAILGGIALAVVGPLVAMTLWPSAPPTSDSLNEYLDDAYRATRFANGICIAGLCLIAFGLFDAFITWASWFAGRRENDGKDAAA